MNKEQILELAKDRLLSLSYDIKENDQLAISFTYDKAMFEIKSFCNITEVKEEMQIPLIEMVVGYFLQGVYASGFLKGEELIKTVKSISEGDISITYNSSSIEEIFNTYTENLINNAKANLIAFRRFKW